MRTYQVKTRNWHGKGWVKKLLDLSGVPHDEDDGDRDIKYWIQTTSACTAWTLWVYFVALRHFSGGWTYIVRPGHELSGGAYNSIY